MIERSISATAPPTFLADEIHLAQLLDSGSGTFDLTLGEDVGEDAAGVGETNHGDVPGIGDVIGEQDAGDPEFGLAFGAPHR